MSPNRVRNHETAYSFLLAMASLGAQGALAIDRLEREAAVGDYLANCPLGPHPVENNCSRSQAVKPGVQMPATVLNRERRRHRIIFSTAPYRVNDRDVLEKLFGYVLLVHHKGLHRTMHHVQ